MQEMAHFKLRDWLVPADRDPRVFASSCRDRFVVPVVNHEPTHR
jgi:hypothetical protein